MYVEMDNVIKYSTNKAFPNLSYGNQCSVYTENNVKKMLIKNHVR